MDYLGLNLVKSVFDKGTAIEEILHGFAGDELKGSASRQALIAELITKGQQFLQAGDLAQADILYRRVLQLAPRNVDALHLLGVIAHRSGKLSLAIDLISQAIKQNSSIASFHLNLGNVFKELERPEEAVTCYQAALRINPNYTKAHNNLGVIFRDQQKFEQALACFQNALQIDPDYVEAYLNLGTAFQLQGKLDQAAESLLQALQLKPDNAPAYFNLGNIFGAQNKAYEAITCFQNALRLNPSDALTYYNLANILNQIGKQADAIVLHREALRLKPDFVAAHNNLSLALLSAHDYSEGWHEYEWRWKAKDSPPLKRDFPQPWWQGEDLTGKTILVWAEQGLGDEILFASMIPDLLNQSCHCVIECNSRLVPLLARSFPAAEVVPSSNPPHPRTLQPDVAFQIPMGSLGRQFRHSLDSFPAHRGYLLPDPQRIAHWRNHLAALGNERKIGICWRSMLQTTNRDFHYSTLEQYGPFLTVPGVIFVNLQYDECRAELAAAEQQFGVKIHVCEEIDLKNDLDEAAALTAALDLVISAPTAVAAMAGALGVPVWRLSMGSTQGTGHIPWYPSMHLFLRAWDESWQRVIEAIAHDLRNTH
jgi:tetratricopeptide (TPR) repeat protein